MNTGAKIRAKEMIKDLGFCEITIVDEDGPRTERHTNLDELVSEVEIEESNGNQVYL